MILNGGKGGGPTCSEETLSKYHFLTPQKLHLDWTGPLWWQTGDQLAEHSRGHISCFGLSFSSPLILGRLWTWLTIEDKCGVFVRNIGMSLPCEAVSYPLRTQSSTFPLRKPRYSHAESFFLALLLLFLSALLSGFIYSIPPPTHPFSRLSICGVSLNFPHFFLHANLAHYDSWHN